MTALAEHLSEVFRRQYDLPNSIKVFDRAMPAIGGPYWVHVENQGETVTNDIMESEGFTFPEGYNNRADLAHGGRVVYIAYASRVRDLPQQ